MEKLETNEIVRVKKSIIKTLFIIRNISGGEGNVDKMIKLSDPRYKPWIDWHMKTIKNPNYVIKFPSDNDYKND